MVEEILDQTVLSLVWLIYSYYTQAAQALGKLLDMQTLSLFSGSESCLALSK